MGFLETLFGFDSSYPVGLEAYLLVAAVLFVFGLIACMTRKSAIGILIGIELILNAVVLNMMAFSRFKQTSGAGDLAGQVFSLFVVILAACEAAVALAIMLNLYFNFGTVEVDLIHEMKE